MNIDKTNSGRGGKREGAGRPRIHPKVDKPKGPLGGKREGAGRPRIHPKVDKPKGPLGGKREGAGRPGSGRPTTRFSFYIPQDLIDFTDSYDDNRNTVINKCVRYVMSLNDPNIFSNNKFE